jgi:hypothetical protein
MSGKKCKTLSQTYHRFSKSVKPVLEKRCFRPPIGLPQSERPAALGRMTEPTDSGNLAGSAYQS